MAAAQLVPDSPAPDLHVADVPSAQAQVVGSRVADVQAGRVPTPGAGAPPVRSDRFRSGPVRPDRRRSTEQRLVDGFLATVARTGYSRIVLDDVAREAGCSRATLYRYFPGKARLARAAVASETARYVDGLHGIAARSADLEEMLVDGLVYTARFVEANGALQHLLRHEPELVVSQLCLANGERFLRLACAALDPVLTPFLAEGRGHRGCEWVARIALAYLAPENTSTDLGDPGAARDLVRDFLLPSLVSQQDPPPAHHDTTTITTTTTTTRG